MTNNDFKPEMLSDLCAAAGAEYGNQTYTVLDEKDGLLLIEIEGGFELVVDTRHPYESTHAGEGSDAFYALKEEIQA